MAWTHARCNRPCCTVSGVFTVQRNIGDMDVVRATVAVTTTTAELDQLVAALTVLSSEANSSGTNA